MEIYFLIVLEAKSPRSKCQEIWILVVGLPPGLLDGCLLAMSSYGLSSVCVERGGCVGISDVSFPYNHLCYQVRASPYDLI